MVDSSFLLISRGEHQIFLMLLFARSHFDWLITNCFWNIGHHPIESIDVLPFSLGVYILGEPSRLYWETYLLWSCNRSWCPETSSIMLLAHLDIYNNACKLLWCWRMEGRLCGSRPTTSTVKYFLKHSWNARSSKNKGQW